MLFFFIFSINKDVIKIHNNKNIKFFYQDLVDVALKCGWYISQAKKYDLILEIAISGLANHFLFIVFLNFYVMIIIN